MNTTKETIVAFKIGRGGRFNNGDHRTFIGIHAISEFTGDLWLHFENDKEIAKAIDALEDEDLRDECNMWFDEARNIDPIAQEKLENALGVECGELIYTDCNGNEVGLTYEEEQTGIGCIDNDGEYDTVYTCKIEDLDEDDIKVIKESHNSFDQEKVLKAYYEQYIEQLKEIQKGVKEALGKNIFILDESVPCLIQDYNRYEGNDIDVHLDENEDNRYQVSFTGDCTICEGIEETVQHIIEMYEPKKENED